MDGIWKDFKFCLKYICKLKNKFNEEEHKGILVDSLTKLAILTKT